LAAAAPAATGGLATTVPVPGSGSLAAATPLGAISMEGTLGTAAGSAWRGATAGAGTSGALTWGKGLARMALARAKVRKSCWNMMMMRRR
jgi:hypothetical protein